MMTRKKGRQGEVTHAGEDEKPDLPSYTAVGVAAVQLEQLQKMWQERSGEGLQQRWPEEAGPQP